MGKEITKEAINEYVDMKNNPGKYKRHENFDKIMSEVINEEESCAAEQESSDRD